MNFINSELSFSLDGELVIPRLQGCSKTTASHVNVVSVHIIPCIARAKQMMQNRHPSLDDLTKQNQVLLQIERGTHFSSRTVKAET
jgi:hypothetical protein